MNTESLREEQNLGRAEDTETFKILSMCLQMQGVSKPTTSEFYESLAELNTYVQHRERAAYEHGLHQVRRDLLTGQPENAFAQTVIQNLLDQSDKPLPVYGAALQGQGEVE